MANADNSGTTISAINGFLQRYGFGATVLAGGIAIIILVLVFGAKFADHLLQATVVYGAGGFGILLFGLGLFWTVRPPALSRSIADDQLARLQPGREDLFDIFIAAPMAGFGKDEEALKNATAFVLQVQVAVQGLRGITRVHSPPFTHPDRSKFDTPTAAFEEERKALLGSRRYLLILPPVDAPASSVLLTAGMAIAMDLPCLVLAPANHVLPYLIEGASQSRPVKLRIERYSSIDDVERIVRIDGLKLFGEEQR
jgi:hypothetical protein